MSSLQIGQKISGTIEKLVFGGAGLLRYQGVVVFVPDTIPGEEVIATITKVKARYAEGSIDTLKTPSRNRITTACPYSSVCGGCQLQHIDPSLHPPLKKEWLREALYKEIPNGMEFDLVPAQQVFGWRRKITLHARWTDQKRWDLGFFAKDNVSIVPISWCPLFFSVDEKEAVQHLKTIFDKIPGTPSAEMDITLFRLPPSEAKKPCQNIVIDSDERATRGPVVLGNSVASYRRRANIGSSMDAASPNLPDCSDRAPKDIGDSTQHPHQVANSPISLLIKGSLFLSKESGKKLIQNLQTLSGIQSFALRFPTIEYTSSHEEFSFTALGNSWNCSIEAFVQNHGRQSEMMWHDMMEIIQATGPNQTIFDLYSGVGVTAISLAQQGYAVTAVELSEPAVQAAQRSAKAILSRSNRLKLIQSSVEDFLAHVKERADWWIVNPPRTGLSQYVCSQMARLASKRILYVSCSPPTLARDIALLRQAGWTLSFLKAYDMFPQTTHFETIAMLGKQDAVQGPPR
jgi:23S rRNA (uracil1939-C5)-methyltransferase